MVGVFRGIVSFLCSNCAAPFFFTVNLKIIKQSTNHSFCSYSSGMLSLHADNILDKEHNEPLLHTFYAKEIVIDNHACTRDLFNNICRHILAHLHTFFFFYLVCDLKEKCPVDGVVFHRAQQYICPCLINCWLFSNQRSLEKGEQTAHCPSLINTGKQRKRDNFR